VKAYAHVMERRAPDMNVMRQRIDDLVRRSLARTERSHRDAAHNVGGCVWRLKSLDPYATLDRGYAIVQKGGGVVSGVGQVKSGDRLDVRVKDGTFGAVAGEGAAPAPRRRSRRAIPDAQAPLFTMPEERA
jgi:exodeoxyribonuclease VII large subunit